MFFAWIVVMAKLSRMEMGHENKAGKSMFIPFHSNMAGKSGNLAFDSFPNSKRLMQLPTRTAGVTFPRRCAKWKRPMRLGLTGPIQRYTMAQEETSVEDGLFFGLPH